MTPAGRLTMALLLLSVVASTMAVPLISLECSRNYDKIREHCRFGLSCNQECLDGYCPGSQICCPDTYTRRLVCVPI